MFQAREAASERPQMLPKMIGDHLAVRVNSVSGCHRLMAPHTVQSDRISGLSPRQSVRALELTSDPAIGGRKLGRSGLTSLLSVL